MWATSAKVISSSCCDFFVTFHCGARTPTNLCSISSLSWSTRNTFTVSSQFNISHPQEAGKRGNHSGSAIARKPPAEIWQTWYPQFWPRDGTNSRNRKLPSRYAFETAWTLLVLNAQAWNIKLVSRSLFLLDTANTSYEAYFLSSRCFADGVVISPWILTKPWMMPTDMPTMLTKATAASWMSGNNAKKEFKCDIVLIRWRLLINTTMKRNHCTLMFEHVAMCPVLTWF